MTGSITYGAGFWWILAGAVILFLLVLGHSLAKAAKLGDEMWGKLMFRHIAPGGGRDVDMFWFPARIRGIEEALDRTGDEAALAEFDWPTDYAA